MISSEAEKRMLVSYILCHRQSCKHVDLTCSSASRKLHCSNAKFFSFLVWLFFHSVFRLVILLLLLSFHFHSIRIHVFIWQLLDFVALREQKRVKMSKKNFFLSPKYYNPLDCSFSQLFVTIHYHSTIILYEWKNYILFFSICKSYQHFFSISTIMT